MMKKILLGILLLVSFLSFSQNAAEFENGITIQKEQVLASKYVSYGESYINNWRDLVLDDGATYFPNNGGYEIGRLHQAEINTSLHFIPAAVGEGVIYAIGKNRTNDFDVDRASLATYIDEDRILRTAAFHVARIDYTDGDGAFLFEDESINLIERSETFSNAYWTKSGASVTSGFSAPDDTTNAYNLVEGGAGEGVIDHTIYVNFIPVTGSTLVTISIFVKASELYKIGIQDVDYGTGWATFDLNTVSVLDNDGLSANIIILQNGWRRIDCTFTSNPAGTLGFGLYLLPNSYTTGKSSDQDYTGDGTSGVYIFGAQVEEGTGSSYIKSDSGSSTTRLADVITGAGDVNTFNSKEGVLFVEMAALSDDGTNRRLSINDNTVSNSVSIVYKIITNQIGMVIRVGGSIVADKTYTSSDVTQFHKIAIKWALNDFALWIDGVEEETDFSGATFGVNVLNNFSFDRGDGGDDFYGKVESIKVFKRALSDSELELLTKMFGFMFLCRIRRKETEYKIAA